MVIQFPIHTVTIPELLLELTDDQYDEVINYGVPDPSKAYTLNEIVRLWAAVRKPNYIIKDPDVDAVNELICIYE